MPLIQKIALGTVALYLILLLIILLNWVLELKIEAELLFRAMLVNGILMAIAAGILFFWPQRYTVLKGNGYTIKRRKGQTVVKVKL